MFKREESDLQELLLQGHMFPLPCTTLESPCDSLLGLSSNLNTPRFANGSDIYNSAVDSNLDDSSVLVETLNVITSCWISDWSEAVSLKRPLSPAEGVHQPGWDVDSLDRMLASDEMERESKRIKLDWANGDQGDAQVTEIKIETPQGFLQLGFESPNDGNALLSWSYAVQNQLSSQKNADEVKPEVRDEETNKVDLNSSAVCVQTQLPTQTLSTYSSESSSSSDSDEKSEDRFSQRVVENNRGKHIRSNPDMQKTARAGQVHWHEQVRRMREEYEANRTADVHPSFAEQKSTCSFLNLKCQKESLLLFLHRAVQREIITPLQFVHPADEKMGFLGWTGFYIKPGCGAQFRSEVEAMFPEVPKVNTLYHLFRRVRLVPCDWRKAWKGEVPFSWNPDIKCMEYGCGDIGSCT
mmetsp:Transcript_22772/g.51329  ORF Transcript_22772/g.51329 Transcript_22772/m.51329 type:complete len:411 (-) Transcript_22772:133-1365(-)|eukprot:764539-Hanusia_phi.AAC.11